MGGRSKGGGGHTPHEAPDSLRSAQKLRAIGLISLGPIKGPTNKWKDTYFDNTPIQNANGVDDNDAGSFNFKNTEIQYNLGYQDQKPLDGFEASEREVSVGAEVKQQHPITRSVIDPDVTRLRLTIGVNALISQNDQGDTNGTSVDFQILVNNTPRGTYQIVGKSSSRFYRSYIIDDLPPRPFTVTVKRFTADSKSQRLQNGTHWVSYTEIIDTKLSYPNMAIVGIKTDSRYNPNFPNINFLLYGRIIKIPTTYNPEARTYAPGIWKGDWKLGWTNNPAWIFYDLITNKLAGLGQRIGDYGIDKFQLYEIAKYCDELVDDGYGGKEPRMVSNLWLTEQREAYNVLSDMASVFRAIAVWDGTQFTAIQDRPADPVCLYSQSNVKDGKFTRQYAAGKAIFTAVEVEYADERNMYQKAIEYVADDGMIARYGYNVKKMTAYGCTSRGQAHRYGKWVLETSRLEQCTITFAVGRQGLMHLPGDIIEVADNSYAGKVLGGRVVAISGKKVTLDQPVEIKGESYLNYITADGLVKIKIKSVDKANPAIIDLDSVPQGLSVFDNWVLKSGVVSTQLYRALGITENDDGSYTITALQHEPQKEAIVDGSASFMPSATTAHGAGVNKPANADVSFGDGGVKLTWTTSTNHGAVKYDVKLYRNGNLYSTHLDLDSPEISFDNLPNGRYTVEIRSKNRAGQLSDPITRTFEINLNIPRFVTKSLLFAIELDWDLPKTATVGNYTEVWRSTTNDISKAVKVATLPYPQNNYVMSGVPLSAEYYFWLRCGDKNDNKGEFTAAVFGEADHNPDNLLNAIEGKITKSHLGQELINSLKNDVNSAVSAETQKRHAALIAEANSRVKAIQDESIKISKKIEAETLKAAQGLQAEINARGTAIQKLEQVDNQQAKAIEQVTAKANSALSGIEVEREARIAADNAESKAREILTAKIGQHESSINQINQTIVRDRETSAQQVATLESAVRNIRVGGRNYLLDSSFKNGKWYKSQGGGSKATIDVDNGVLTISSDNATWKQYQINGYAHKGGLNELVDGAKVTISFEVMTPDDNTNGVIKYWMNMRADRIDNTHGGSTNPIVINQTAAPSKWSRVSVTGIAIQPTNFRGWRFILGVSTPGTVKFRNPKLEVGNVATDWTPAPEDTDSTISAVSADLTSYKQAQATKEQATAQQISGLTTRMANAESGISKVDKAVSDAKSSTATQLNQLSAAFRKVKTDLDAKIEEEKTARANADRAEAEKTATMTSRVANAESKISQVSKTVADVSGKLSSTHTIKTQVVGGGRTAIAGIALGASSDGKTAESSVIVMADKFGIVANANDSNVKQVFSVANGQVGIRGDLVVAGSVTNDKLSSGSGANLLTNPIFANPTNGVPYGWNPEGNAPNANRECRQDPDWGLKANGYLPNENVLKYWTANDAGAATYFGVVQRVPVTANRWYMASAYMGNHRSSKVELIIQYVNSNNVANGVIHLTAGTGYLFGGINNAERAKIKFKAPVDCVAINFYLRKTATQQGQANSYMFVARPMLEECTEYTTEPSPWANAGVTAVHGGSIIANTIRGDHIQANQEIRTPRISGGEIDISGNDGILRVGRTGNFLVRASSQNRGLVMNNDQIIVYDERGNVRVKIGRL
ncbi:putative phage tail protein [Haemophilus influenzae]|uniref:TipJ family phage tail tip protein n=1 Tax=Haemophilus influenzae TaxID=727 RepID=UPI000765214E|nr:phage tail protein [Haemophilus influenzae]CVQ11983.1 phage hyaluronidase [Streptococcus pneumoniae]CWX14409.1 putative phage tail protein [Haemophilus influenzae]CWX27243.1 putative phage tail protein [Haemophilus influenzae]CWX34121.1 putative phage tail protein [Haemophilus influenzae]CWX47876.1 putative phage tail protein [Haemophilus influenzae]